MASHRQKEDSERRRKVAVIRETENGKKKADMCQEFGLVNSTAQTIWKSRTKIITAFEQSGWRIK
jgi:hypothetical protein